MKICCYEKFITRSSGTACISTVCKGRGVPCLQPPPARVPPAPISCCPAQVLWVRAGCWGAGQTPLSALLPSFFQGCQNRVGGFLPAPTGRLLRGAVASHSKMPSFFFPLFSFFFFLSCEPKYFLIRHVDITRNTAAVLHFYPLMY